MASTTGTGTTGTATLNSRSNGANTPQPDIEWLFAVVEKGQPVLYTLQLKLGQTGATVMQLLKKEFEGTKPFRHWFHTNFQLEDAIISPLCVGDPEAQDYPRKVIIESTTPRADLTKAFHNPLVLRGTDFTRLHEQFRVVTGPAPAGRQCHAILIKTATSKKLVVGVVIAVILFSIVVGVVTGFLVKDANIGLTVFAGVLAIFAFIQASLFGASSLRSDKTV